MSAGALDPGAPRLYRRLLEGGRLGLWSGTLGGAFAGLVDATLAWPYAAQYLPSVAGRSRMVLYFCGIDALFGGLFGALAGLFLALLWFGAGVRALLGGLCGAQALACSISATFVVVAAVTGISTLMVTFARVFANTQVVLESSGLIALYVLLLVLVGAVFVHRAALAVATKLPASVSTRLALATLFVLPVALVVERWRAKWIEPEWVTPDATGSGLALLLGAIASALVLGRAGAARSRIGHGALTAGPVLSLALVLSLGSAASLRKAVAVYSYAERNLTRLLPRGAGLARGEHSPVPSERRAGADEAPPAPPAALGGPLNLLLITIDALRADHLGCYGYPAPTSPRLDALAKAAVVFERAYASAPLTSEAVPSILTGRDGPRVLWQTPCPSVRGCLSPANVTLAEILHESGYATGALLDHRYFFLLGEGSGHDQGFDSFEQGGWRVEEAAARFFEARRAPWFLWIHVFDPHADLPGNDYDVHPGVPTFGPRKIDRYDGEIFAADTHVGGVLDELSRARLADRTVVVVMADHGEAFAEHGTVYHGSSLFNEQTAVPLIIRAPGFAPRRVVEPVVHTDVLPTVLDLLSIRRPAAIDGRSALGHMAGSTAPREVHQAWSDRRALVLRDWKLIWDRNKGTFELYDLVNDGAERHDLWEDPRVEATARELRSKLVAWDEALESR